MADEPPTYLFDTSSLNRIRTQPDSNVAWNVIIGLIEEGRGLTVPEVMDELEKINPAAFDRLNAHRAEMVLRRTNARFVSSAEIRSQYPKMSKANKHYDSADAWVVGVAKVEGFVVVTNEIPKGHGQKMPKVCDNEKVPWVSLEGLIEIEGP